MALITITGYPCSGKTRRANQLKAALESRLQDPSYSGPQFKVKILSDDELNLTRDAYKGRPANFTRIYPQAHHDTTDSRTEKPARAALFTAMQRQMSQDTILIIDAMNYIKGFRYQMYCAAREQRLRVCTVSGPSFVGLQHSTHRASERSRSSLSRHQNYARSGIRPARTVIRTPQKRESLTSCVCPLPLTRVLADWTTCCCGTRSLRLWPAGTLPYSL